MKLKFLNMICKINSNDCAIIDQVSGTLGKHILDIN